jgi:hypothetical protein
VVCVVVAPTVLKFRLVCGGWQEGQTRGELVQGALGDGWLLSAFTGTYT